MALYLFYLRGNHGAAPSPEAYELPTDGEAFERAAILLDRHPSADHVEIWAQDRAVAARHRRQPIIRPIAVLAPEDAPRRGRAAAWG
jgi:hypothetical protein